MQRLTKKASARMAELVDALVSNTNGSNTVPVRSRLRVQKELQDPCNSFFVLACAVCRLRVRLPSADGSKASAKSPMLFWQSGLRKTA